MLLLLYLINLIQKQYKTCSIYNVKCQYNEEFWKKNLKKTSYTLKYIVHLTKIWTLKLRAHPIAFKKSIYWNSGKRWNCFDFYKWTFKGNKKFSFKYNLKLGKLPDIYMSFNDFLGRIVKNQSNWLEIC